MDDFVAGQFGSSDTYGIVLGYNLLTNDNIHALQSTGRVNGLIVLLREAMDAKDLVSVHSPEGACPNCEFGLYADDDDPYQWNPQGQDLLQRAFDIPIFGINPVNRISKQIYNYVMRTVEYNEEQGYDNYPLQAVDFELFMWAAVNAETCLRRGWCEVVGGMSVYSTPSFDIQADDNKPIVMLTAAMDGRSLFHDLTNGAVHDVSGLVGVLAAAEALSHVSTTDLPKHILYTLFTAESWGYAGSQRFVQDISQPFTCTNASRAVACPYGSSAPCTNPCVRTLDFKRINFDTIDAIIELGSVANASGSEHYWAHVDDTQTSQSIIATLQQQSTTGGSSSNNNNTHATAASVRSANEDNVQRRLPPGSSTMSFLKQKRNIPAAVITDFQKELGSLYNSDLDDDTETVNLASICQLATTTARTVYLQAQGNTSIANQITANCTLVESLMDCLVSNFSCPLMQNYFNVSGINRISHYASVFSFRNPQPQLLSRFVFTFLADVTRRPQPQNPSSACTTIQDCHSGEYCVRQQCVQTFTNYHDAYGTGLSYDEATGEILVVDPTKPTWTESTWNTPVFRTFLVTSRKQQAIELVVGVLWTVISIVGVIFGKRYFRKTFKTE
ncbi:Nicastrin-domain-containing protein [Zychaea mexicana]|uniref:Nicastrin-domain-containing protein n=1 Tax=Zychaea mexicana TaxID=64656 RepID=UPI0022FEF5C6|nr:Nicastrin-domain-containing protein [Zychaea mexicana]KAI9484451.1 Nicastrin-domain-containing protein [Zychaea mexicana]